MHIIQGTTHQKWQDYLENGGTVGPFPYESGVVSLFKLVRADK